ncbi:hypothetical protein LWS69_12550 [Bordetella hinzii]|nr:hypothetical protein [Bordetella hinzii]
MSGQGAVGPRLDQPGGDVFEGGAEAGACLRILRLDEAVQGGFGGGGLGGQFLDGLGEGDEDFLVVHVNS